MLIHLKVFTNFLNICKINSKRQIFSHQEKLLLIKSQMRQLGSTLNKSKGNLFDFFVFQINVSLVVSNHTVV